MPVEPILFLLAVAVIANLLVMAAVLVPALLGRPGPFDQGDGGRVAADRIARPASRAERGERGAPPAPGHAPVRRRRTVATEDDEERGGELAQVLAGDASSPTFDRVVRIVSWAFILSTSVIVAVTGLWPTTGPEIYVTLALGGIFVLVVHDLLPPAALGPARFIVEGSAAIVFVTVLVILTGQADSPFFFVYPLIVGGAALVVPPLVTLVLAVAAGIGYLVAVLADPRALPPSGHTVATIGVNLTALCLLAYAGMVISRQQRLTRDIAVRLSTIDSLTELFNRAYFFAVVDREIQRSARFRRGFCLLMMDLDGLKAINDRYGHFHGDRVLRGVAGVIRTSLRQVDTAARYGGDEFVVLLPETDPSGAYVVAEKIRQSVSDLLVEAGESRIRASLSIGVVAYPEDGRTADELMITADEAMYGSKRLGKNRVVGFAPVGGTGSPVGPAPVAQPGGPASGPTLDEDEADGADDEDEDPADEETRGGANAAGRPVAARATPPPAVLHPAGGGRLGRRFRTVRHDDDEQLRRTMEHFLSDEPPRRRRAAGDDRSAPDAGDPGRGGDSV
ncbi:MAG TPA: GGDEF domain-containing protein [Candidatus Limnocylindrales bacterium]